jgi:hypothetical protein
MIKKRVSIWVAVAGVLFTVVTVWGGRQKGRLLRWSPRHSTV